MKLRRAKKAEAELDITSFMNLMIILVPVLLMSMVFSHITVHQLVLPNISDASADDDKKPKILELVIRKEYFDLNYPAGTPLKRIPKVVDESTEDGMAYDFKQLSTVLQEIKRQLKDKGIEKKDITLLSEQDTDYQTIITTMDTVRSFKAVVVTSVVDAELFPQISLGDAPFLPVTTVNGASANGVASGGIAEKGAAQ
ncbi:MAG: biopolymer transporter ExbD [Cellvibrionaceae bacterium]